MKSSWFSQQSFCLVQLKPEPNRTEDNQFSTKNPQKPKETINFEIITHEKLFFFSFFLFLRIFTNTRSDLIQSHLGLTENIFGIWKHQTFYCWKEKMRKREVFVCVCLWEPLHLFNLTKCIVPFPWKFVILKMVFSWGKRGKLFIGQFHLVKFVWN